MSRIKETPILVFKIIKNIVLNLYKGLVYWFFWASFVTLRDEMFCSYASVVARDKSYNIATSANMPPVKTATADACRTLVKLCNNLAHASREALDILLDGCQSALRAMMAEARELPQRHRLRLALYSG